MKARKKRKDPPSCIYVVVDRDGFAWVGRSASITKKGAIRRHASHLVGPRGDGLFPGDTVVKYVRELNATKSGSK